MKYIDLHVHSDASDGTLTPTEIVKKGIQQNLAALALTDHDTVQGIEEAVIAAKHLSQEETIQIIPGIELSAEYNKKDIHILGLFIDHKNPYFCQTLDSIKQERESRNDKMAQNLTQAGIPISLTELHKEYPDAIITRAHFAKFLTKLNVVKDYKEAFQKYLSDDSPYYVSRKYLSPKAAIDLIQLAGGIPVLAHPLLYQLSTDKLDQLIAFLKDAGLMGIEVMHSTNVDFDEAFLKKYASKYNLLITGGSDYHGANKPLIELGVGKNNNLRIPYSLLESLEAARKILQK